MANLFKRLVEGKEKSDDYARSTLPTNRFSLFWDVFKNNFFKLMGVNVFILLFFLPVIFLFLQRSNLVLLSAEKIPFSSNLVTGYPIVPIRPGQEEAINLLANRWFYFMMPIAAIIASIGLSGGLYIIRNLIWTEGVLVVSDLWRGIKKNFLQIMEIALIYSVVLLITMVGANYLTYLQAVGWSHAWLLSAARVMCYVALGIATLMTMHMLTMSVTYKLSIFKLLNNSFVFSYALIIPNLFFGAIALLPFILLLALPMSAFYGMWLILVVLLGFSFSFLVWMDYTQWAFDKFVNPRIEGARVNRGIYKGGESEQESAAFKQYREQKKETLKQLAEDHLVSNPIKPIDDDIVVEELPEHYTIKDLERLKAQKDKMIEDANAWAEEHKNDEKYAVFAEFKKEASEQDEARRKKLETYKKKEQKRNNKKK